MFRHYRVILRELVVSTLPGYTSMSNAVWVCVKLDTHSDSVHTGPVGQQHQYTDCICSHHTGLYVNYNKNICLYSCYIVVFLLYVCIPVICFIPLIWLYSFHMVVFLLYGCIPVIWLYSSYMVVFLSYGCIPVI